MGRGLDRDGSMPTGQAFAVGPGMKLSAEFFHEYVAPLADERLGRSNYAAALLGGGSEVLGLDTEMSTDHDWGPTVALDAFDRGGPGGVVRVLEALGALTNRRLSVYVDPSPRHFDRPIRVAPAGEFTTALLGTVTDATLTRLGTNVGNVDMLFGSNNGASQAHGPRSNACSATRSCRRVKCAAQLRSREPARLNRTECGLRYTVRTHQPEGSGARVTVRRMVAAWES